jgi:hypothetical protein
MYIDSPWTIYAAVLSPLTIGYYIFIGYKFYRQDLRSAFSGKQNRPVKKIQRPAPSISVTEEPNERSRWNQKLPSPPYPMKKPSKK